MVRACVRAGFGMELDWCYNMVSKQPTILVVVSLILTGCDGGYDRNLTDNFVLHRSSDNIVMILRRGDASLPRHESHAEPEYDIVLGARVSEYAVTPSMIVGRVEHRPESPYSYLARPGWFCLSRTNGFLEAGLTKSECIGKLKRNGIDFESIQLRRAP